MYDENYLYLQVETSMMRELGWTKADEASDKLEINQFQMNLHNNMFNTMHVFLMYLGAIVFTNSFFQIKVILDIRIQEGSETGKTRYGVGAHQPPRCEEEKILHKRRDN